MINPEYGVPKTADQLTTQTPMAVLYSVTPSNQFIPSRADSVGRLEVNVSGGGVITGEVTFSPNLYGTSTQQYFHDEAVPSNTETVIGLYTVPSGKIFYLTDLIFWGGYAAEFILYIDTIVIGGGQTSVANPTGQISYGNAPFAVIAGQQIKVAVTHLATGTMKFRANILGGLQ